MKKIVVVVGGGYGGLRLIEKLAPLNSFEITLIDKNRYHYLQTEVYKFLSGRSNICDITYNLNSFCAFFKNVKFINDEAVNIDSKRSFLICKNNRYFFDYLIIATGAIDFFPKTIKNIEKYSVSIKDLNSAFSFKQRFLKDLFEEIAFSKKIEIVIGGAGLSGVELAADLKSISKDCSKDIGQKNILNVTLIEASNTILPGSSKKIVEEANKRLKSLGIKIILNTPIIEVTQNEIVLKDKKIEYDSFIFTGGIVGGDFIKNLNYPKNSKNQLIVDEYLKIDKNIFAIGDCAQILDINGNILPSTAQIAEQSAEYVAKIISNKTKDRFNGKIYGMFIALGKNYAVGHILNRIFLKGRLANFVKMVITYLYSFNIKIKVNSGYRKRNFDKFYK